ncbi:MAG TPA: ABC transporter permease [Solirubrobacterales bacterium]|nr:ABC transporter permease [Solirubrobacterales bacterium]
MPDRLRARELLRRKAVWVPPLVIGVILIGLMTALYLGSAVDPVDHMDGLPVSLVQRDAGAGSIGGIRVNFGTRLEGALQESPEVTHKLAIHVESMAAAEDRMDRGASYATLVVPPGFTDAALNLVGAPGRHPARPGPPTVRLLSNQRAGTEGASLATGVLDPALAAISQSFGRRLLVETGPRATATTRAALIDPIKVEADQYRPLPAKAALGLSAFYVSLLVMMCGFIGATIVNAGLDGVLGFAPTETGPRWTMARPALISRLQTLLAKWAIAAVLTGVLTAIVLLVAAGLLGMDAPDPLLLWLYGWFCAATVAVGTLSLFAVLGTPGQLIALLIFVYVGLASAGGTVPIQALPGFFATVSHIDPLRQILGGVRSILYLEARADAGLAEGAIATAVGLIFWICLGACFVRRYDRAGHDRMDPDLLAYVHQAADQYREPRSP